MSIKPCIDCGELSNATRCRDCQRSVEIERGKTSSRGYGSRHQKMRQEVAQNVSTGEARCARCGQPIDLGEAWHLDHTDDRAGWLGASHAACNIAASSR